MCVCELAGQDIHQLLVKAVPPQPAQAMVTLAQPGFEQCQSSEGDGNGVV